jgi:putative sigma-54 modulation protein
MQIHLSPRHLRLSAALHQHCAAVIAELEELADIIAAHVVLVHDDTIDPEERFCAKVHLAISGSDVFAEECASDMHVAIDRVGSKLARQLRKRKTSLVDKRRRKVQRAARARRGR